MPQPTMQLKLNCLLLALALVTSASAQGLQCSQLGGTCGGFAGISCCGDAFCGGLDPNIADAAGTCCVARNGNCNTKVDCCDKTKVCRMDRAYVCLSVFRELVFPLIAWGQTAKRCLPPV
ncbi:hypothetical protein B0H13DRAFT_1977610 [Mycena leptocephala]|nr:hypothetical protein B0H13DRAFT_1977610 [Mycena leptocephala]